MQFNDFSHNKVTVNGTQVHYRQGGSGDDVVVLLHGWPQHSLQWHTVAPMIGENYTVITPDLPGCGGSGLHAQAQYDKKSVALLMRAFLEEIGVKSIRLAGYDHGAGVAYNMAVQHPELVSQLAMIEYVLPGLGYEKAMLPSPEWHTGSNWQLALFTVPDVAEFAFRGRERELLNWFLWHGSCNPTPVSQAHLTEYVDQIAKPGALRAGIEYYAAVWKDLKDNEESLKSKLKMPVLGIGGSHNMGPFVGKSLGAVAENSRGEVIQNAGHWVSDENPEALANALLKFFGET